VKRQNLDTDFYFPSLLKEARQALGEEFKRLTHRHQVGYLIIFWDNYLIDRNNRHNKQPDSFVICGEEIVRFFVDQRDFRALNDNGYYLGCKGARHGLSDKVSFSRKEKEGYTKHRPTEWTELTFIGHGGSKDGGRCNGFRFAPKIARMMESWVARQLADDDKEPQGMVNIHGDKVEDVAKKYGGGIVRDKSKVSKKVNVKVLVKISKASLIHHKIQLEVVKDYLKVLNLKTLVKDSKDWSKIKVKLEELGLGNLQNLKDWGLTGVKVNNTKDKSLESLLSKDFTQDGIKQRMMQIDKLLATSKQIGNSKVNVNYYEVNTGRYHTKAGILQGYYKSVRYAALSGCYEYDLEAAHQNILVQLLDREGVSFNELDVVRDYISNKAAIRISLAKELNTTVTIVKIIIQELTYGAKLYNHYTGAIYKTCDGEYQLIERIINNPWLIELADSFSIAHDRLVGDDKQVVNAVGIEVETTKKAKDMAHILQGYERQILDSLIARCNTKDIAILLHDCVIFYNEQSPEKLSQFVREETGFNLKFSEEKY